MKLSKTLFSLGALSISVTMSVAHASPTNNLLANPGFESSPSAFTDWTLSGDDGFFAIGSTPFSGTNDADLSTNSNFGYIAQTLPTTVGGLYFLSFYLQVSDDQPDSEFQAIADTDTLLTLNPAPKSAYTFYFLPYVATSNLTTIQLGVKDQKTLKVDDVSFTIPEPASISVLGFGALALLGRKGRRAANA